MDCFIVILHFGDLAITRACLKSLFANETYSFSVIVVNNAERIHNAKDFSKEKLVVINNKKNFGFAGGVNVGIRYALKQGADAICLLNNDTIIEKPFLEALVTEIKEKNVGIVGPAIEFFKNEKKLYDLGGKVNLLLGRTSHTEVVKITDTKSKEVAYASGCCMLIKSEVFKKIGYFDESFFLYYEDVDFCLRARKKGFLTHVVPSVSIEHELSRSVGKMSPLAIYHLLTSSILFGKKYAKNGFQKIINRLFIFFQSFLFLKTNPHAWKVIARAMIQSN